MRLTLLAVIVVAVAGLAPASPARSEADVPAAADPIPPERSDISGSLPDNLDEATGWILQDDGSSMLGAESGDGALVQGLGPVPAGLNVQGADPDFDIHMDMRGQDLDRGRLTYGPTIGMSLQEQGELISTITPQAHVRGVWDYQNDAEVLNSTGAIDSMGDSGLNVGGGLDVTLSNGLLFSLDGDYSAYSSDLPDWSLRGGIGSPLSALGLADISPSGQLKLDMGASEEALETKAKVAIPLSGGD